MKTTVLSYSAAADRRPNRVNQIGPARAGHNSPWGAATGPKGGRMYAIAFDLDQEMLRAHYPNAAYNHAYDDIRRVFADFGFTRQQGSVYFGNETVTPVTCVMAVQAVQRQYTWFARVISDIRMLRIEEHNDLMPAVGELEFDFNRPADDAAAAG